MEKKQKHDLVLRIGEDGHYRTCLKCGEWFNHFYTLDEDEKYCKVVEKSPKEKIEHKAKALTKEEVEQGRSNAYKYLDL